MTFKVTDKVNPGSLWRIKGDMAAHYLFDEVEEREFGDFCPPVAFVQMQEENFLMVVKHEIINGRHHFAVLGNKTIYTDLNIPIGTWDNVFVAFKPFIKQG